MRTLTRSSSISRSINDRAADTLDSASRIEEWHAVSVPRFGEYGTPHKTGLVTVGDSTAFVDPFTGSGMLMAIESARLLADIISRYGMDRERINTLYPDAYRKLFSSRLKTSGIIRAVAYEPLFSTAAVRLLSCSEAPSNIAHATDARSPRL